MSSREGQLGSSSIDSDASGFAHSPSPEEHDSAPTKVGGEIDRVTRATKRIKKKFFIMNRYNLLMCGENGKP